MNEIWCRGSILDQERLEGAALPDGSWPPSDWSFVFKQVWLYLYLIFVAFCLWLIISLFGFNADAVRAGWKR